MSSNDWDPKTANSLCVYWWQAPVREVLGRSYVSAQKGRSDFRSLAVKSWLSHAFYKPQVSFKCHSGSFLYTYIHSASLLLVNALSVHPCIVSDWQPSTNSLSQWVTLRTSLWYFKMSASSFHSQWCLCFSTNTPTFIIHIKNYITFDSIYNHHTFWLFQNLLPQIIPGTTSLMCIRHFKPMWSDISSFLTNKFIEYNERVKDSILR